ncbi:protein MAM3 [Colletotrichum spaethianum]|uniref:Protein MAM3 n=1 Tax=Colletotrichum spaethianum TaxID=700344 RepID=A0AA37LIA9_9PEZI|nr:protein MAM3 [Colletotrichum spaethianum]GKT46465.1 protein MAM3 [Colletotrichum spaethianum]
MATRGVVPTRRANNAGGFGLFRTAVLGLTKALTLGVSSVAAAPIHAVTHPDKEPEADGASFWPLMGASIALVLLGGAFAGLTIALMGQDSIYLQVLAGDPDESQSKNAKRVYNLLKKGKHWVLVTLLLSNVIVNESLPVVLDRCLGGGVEAVVGSTVLIVIFGEVVPQSVCVRYGLQIGGYMSKPVLVLMWLMAPIAWPTAKLLDWALGEDHGTVYKKSGLKTLVTLHKSLGEVGERLNQDEVTIISAVLDLKEKPVENVMTPMDDVFIMAEDTVLDEKTMDRILSEGYSRIPIHATGKPTDFVGMLLVKILITYDPEDCLQVKDFPLATLPETRPETSCLDIVNFFQEGKSHMVLVSEYPGADYGAIGVVTLEDVIEELIGEEIIDESDVYIDVHKAIRRMTPAPKARTPKKSAQPSPRPIPENGDLIEFGEEPHPPYERNGSISALSDAPENLSSSAPRTTFLMRRSSAGPDGRMTSSAVPVKATFDEAKQHLKHLGPSNRASNPKNTKSTTVKIKPVPTGAPLSQLHSPSPALRPASVTGDVSEHRLDEETDEHTPLMRPKLSGKGGVHAIRKSYGAAGKSETQVRLSSTAHDEEDDKGADGVNVPATVPENGSLEASRSGSPEAARTDLTIVVSPGQVSSATSVTSIVDEGSATPKRRPLVRSGSISENVVETSSGVRKIIIQAASSDSDEAGSKGSSGHRSRTTSQANVQTAGRDAESEEHDGDGASSTAPSTNNSQQASKKKNRRKKRKNKS